MNDFLITAISGSIMILIVLLIRALFANRLYKRALPIFWALITLRLMIPASFGIPMPYSFEIEPLTKTDKSVGNTVSVPETSLPQFTPPTVSEIQDPPIINYTPITPGETSEITPELPLNYGNSENSVSLPAVLVVIWIVGVLLFALYFTFTYIRCMKFFSFSLPIGEHKFIDKWISEHSSHSRKFTVRYIDGIISPLTYGILKPVILLPGNYDELTDEELNIILTHEYVHINRFDTVLKLALTAALCLYWFDPFVWMMYILANRDIEFACDDEVLCRLGGERQQYARTLLRMEELKGGNLQ